MFAADAATGTRDVASVGTEAPGRAAAGGHGGAERRHEPRRCAPGGARVLGRENDLSVRVGRRATAHAPPAREDVRESLAPSHARQVVHFGGAGVAAPHPSGAAHFRPFLGARPDDAKRPHAG
jgi:hypothetical protein